VQELISGTATPSQRRREQEEEEEEEEKEEEVQEEIALLTPPSSTLTSWPAPWPGTVSEWAHFARNGAGAKERVRAEADAALPTKTTSLV
jgi:hypothetical protein